ncbi:MAG: polysaccharide deacetylase family protein [bacterium]
MSAALKSTAFLMYHELERAGRPLCSNEPGYVRYVVREDDFRAQMDHVVASGKRGVSVSAWLDADDASAKRSVVLTFDDGCETDLIFAAPLLEERGFGATCYLTVDFLDRRGYLTRAQVRELAGTGIEVGCHSMSHAYLSDLDDVALHREIVQSKQELESISGVRVRSFSCPGGRYDDRVLPVARAAGYDSVTTSKSVWNVHALPADLLGRIVILQDTSMERFVATLSGRDIGARKLRDSALTAAKAILGNSLYEKLRKTVLG